MNINQIRSVDGTGTLSYLLIDNAGSSAVLIDPNLEDVERITKLIREANVQLTHIFDTHTHADHVSGAAELQTLFVAKIVMHENTKNKWKVLDQGDKFGIGDTLRANGKIPIDVYVHDGDKVSSGSMNVHVLFTPGHTDNHITLHVEDCIFTGDLLLIGQAGRSDLPGGNASDQYESLMNKIIPLPDATKMYPGHDYENNTFTLLRDEKKNNPFLQQRTIDEYIQFVEEFFPPLAEQSEAGGKMTLQCGVQRVAQRGDAFRNITPEELNEMLVNKPLLLDVREPFELLASGAIEGVENISVNLLKNRIGELPQDKSLPVVAICASGSRSAEAAHLLQQEGYKNVMNLIGGTMGWIQKGFPVVRSKTKVS